MRQGCFLALTLLIVVRPAAGLGTQTLYVDASAPPGGDGLTWASALFDLQQALGVARAAAGFVGEIRVAQGTYKPAPPGGDRTVSFGLVEGVALRGGYAGRSAEDPNQRDFVLFETTLSGDLNGDDESKRFSDNSFHVVTAHLVSAATTLEGFSITAGRADDDGLPHDAGGGLRVDRAFPVVSRCTFFGNTAVFGGAIELFNEANAVISRCNFIENSATRHGGGVHTNASSPLIWRCLFSGNSAGLTGGGLRAWNGGTLTLQDGVFQGNAASEGGAVSADASAAILNGVVFTGNVSVGDGGAVFGTAGATLNVTSAMFDANASLGGNGGALIGAGDVQTSLRWCRFLFNRAAGAGGAVGHVSSSATIANCRFLRNLAKFGGAVWNAAGTVAVIQDCLFHANLASDNGGAIDTNASTLRLSDSTLVHNAAGIGVGGGLWNVNSADVQVTSSILWSNHDVGGLDESAQLDLSADSTLVISYSTLEGWSGLRAGTGVSASTPRFVNPAGADGTPGNEDDDFRLTCDSNAINAGDPTFVPNPGRVDLSGRPRVACGRVDQGAFEYGLGDANCDRAVAADDWTLAAACETGPGSEPYGINCLTFDAEPDGDIDLADWASVLNQFTGEACGIAPDHPSICAVADGDCFDVHATAGCTDLSCCLAVCEANPFCCDVTWSASCPLTAAQVCEVEPLVPNDVCDDSVLVSDGTFSFDNFGATLDGPPVSQSCPLAPGGNGYEIDADIWFCYTATCTGTAIVSLCGSDFDTTLAVHSGCACPVKEALACSDDDCGFLLDSRVAVPVAQGESLVIRVGGFAGGNAQGTGDLTLICTSDPDNSRVCALGSGSCDVDNGTPGCDEPSCCNAVCQVDRFCCDVEWDATCAAEAEGICDGSFSSCGPGSGVCTMANGTPGCADADCCNTVCASDPYCCVVEWDQTCATSASTACP